MPSGCSDRNSAEAAASNTDGDTEPEEKGDIVKLSTKRKKKPKKPASNDNELF